MFILIIALAGSLTSTLNAGFTRGQRIAEESKNASTIGPTGPQGIQGNTGPAGPTGSVLSGLYVEWNGQGQPLGVSGAVEFNSKDAFFGTDITWNILTLPSIIFIHTAGYYMITFGAILDSATGSLQLFIDNAETTPKIILECSSSSVMSSITFLHYFDAPTPHIIQLINATGDPRTIKNAFPGVFFNIIRVQ